VTAAPDARTKSSVSSAMFAPRPTSTPTSPAARQKLGRQRDTLEMIARKNSWRARCCRPQERADQQVRRGSAAGGTRRCEYVESWRIARPGKALFGADFPTCNPHRAPGNRGAARAYVAGSDCWASTSQRRSPDPRHEAELLGKLYETLLTRRRHTHLIDMDRCAPRRWTSVRR